jgi:hypothetical protein
MKIPHRSRLTLGSVTALAVLLLLESAPAWGQSPPSHVPIPVWPKEAATPGAKLLIIYQRGLPRDKQEDLNRILQNVSPAQRQMIDYLLANPAAAEKLQADPKAIGAMLEKIKKNPSDAQIDDPEMQRWIEKAKQQASAAQNAKPSGSHAPVAAGGPSGPTSESETPAKPAPEKPQTPPDTPPNPPDADEDAGQTQPSPWRQQVLDFLEELRDEDGPLGKSPALREAMHDLSMAALDSFDGDPRGKLSGRDLDRQISQWSQTLHDVKAWTEPARASVRRLGVSSWAGVRSPRLKSGWARTPSFGSAGLAGPALSGMGAGTVIGWLVLVAALAGVLWQVLVRSQRAVAAAEDTVWKLGPWPVVPSEVRTRGQLVQAFEYLSLLRLGRAARSWNHLEIAARLGGDDARRRQAAAELADIYEHARYAPGDEPLADEALTEARRDLCLLAGVATA